MVQCQCWATPTATFYPWCQLTASWLDIFFHCCACCHHYALLPNAFHCCCSFCQCCLLLQWSLLHAMPTMMLPLYSFVVLHTFFKVFWFWQICEVHHDFTLVLKSYLEITSFEWFHINYWKKVVSHIFRCLMQLSKHFAFGWIEIIIMDSICVYIF